MKCYKINKIFLSVLCICAIVVHQVPVASADTTLPINGGYGYSVSVDSQMVVSYDQSKNTLAGKKIMVCCAFTYGTEKKVLGISEGVFGQTQPSYIYVEVKADNYKIEKEAFAGCIVTDTTGEAMGNHVWIAQSKVDGEYLGSINYIGESAFEKATVAGDMNIAPSIETIETKAFAECNVGRLLLLPDVGTIRTRAFQNAVVGDTLRIKSVKVIEPYAFCALDVPNVKIWSAQEIGDGAFLNNATMSSITLPDNLEKLGSKVFEGCSKLSEITLSDSKVLTEVAVDALPDKEGLVVVIPASMTLSVLNQYHIENYKNVIFQIAADSEVKEEIAQAMEEKQLNWRIGEDGEIHYSSTDDDENNEESGGSSQTETPGNGNSSSQTETPGNGNSSSQTETPENGNSSSQTETPGNGNSSSQTETSGGGSGEIVSLPSKTPVEEGELATDGSTDVANPQESQEAAGKESAVFQADGLQYQIIGNKTVSCMGAVKKTQKKVAIPSTVSYDNRKYKVTAIGEKAFYQMKKLKRVVLGDNVKVVGEKAFALDTKLQYIQFGKGLSVLKAKVLYGDKNLKQIRFKGKQLKKIGKKSFTQVPVSVYISAPGKNCSAKYAKLINAAG